MVAAFAYRGVIRAFSAAFVIILEMTGNNANVISLMVAAILGFGTSKVIAR